MKRTIELFGGAAYTYYASVAVAELLTKHCPQLKVSVTETIGSVENIEKSKGKNPNSFLLQAVGDSYITSRLGLGVWQDKEKVTNLKWICGLDWGHHALATLDPNIKKMADFKGKKLAIPSHLVEMVLVESFNVLGIDAKIEVLGFAKQYEALRDGLVDGCVWQCNGPPGSVYTNVPPLRELLKVKTVYGVPLPREIYLKAKKTASQKLGCELAYSPGIILAGTLPTQTEDMECFSGSVLGYLCHKDADEELIYDITRTLATQYYRLGELFPNLNKLTPHLMVQLMYLGHDPRIKVEDEIHPGALRYYREVGLWPNAWERRKEVRLD